MNGRSPDSIHQEFVKAFNAADPEALVGLYEPEAVLAVQPSGSVTGRDAIRKAYRGYLASKPKIVLRTAAILESADGMAMLHGKWEMTRTQADGSEMHTDGRNTEVVRRQADGRWLFVIDNPFTP